MVEPKLLTREQFKQQVFARDKNKCVFCELPAVDAHHIIDRKVWLDGGYYLDNGASVCEQHHIDCENSVITVEQVREACSIKHILVPPGFDKGVIYDKWGKMTKYVKYPKTPHLPWSASRDDDDIVIDTITHFEGKRVIITEKMDGENTSMYNDHIHARSIDSRFHASRAWVRQAWGNIKHDIPEGWRICGENVYAEHSIAYKNLESYFLGFSIWNEHNECLSWDETLHWFSLLGITPVPVLYDGIWNKKEIDYITYPFVTLVCNPDQGRHEGYVIRLADKIRYDDFAMSYGKYVRRNHVQTDEHWMFKEVIPNKLKE